MSSQSRDIPGFYFDAERKKYFRIQPNHQVPPSSTGTGSSASGVSKYTRQAVNAAELHTREIRRYQTFGNRKQAENLQRSHFLTHPLHGLDFRIRLGVGRAVGDDLRRQYAWMLRPNTVMASGKAGDRFVVEGGSKTLFTTAEVECRGRASGMREMCVTPLSTTQRQGKSDKATEAPAPKYDSAGTVPILNSHDATNILPLSDRLVIWAFQRPDDDYHGTGSVLCISKKYADDDVPWQNWREEFGEWGTTVRQYGSTIWDFAVPGKGQTATSQPTYFVMTAGHGIKIYNFEYGAHGVSDITNQGPVGLHGSKGEPLLVRFKDDNVFMAGGRSGDVVFGDVRVGLSFVTRMRHSSAVSGLRSMRNDNLVLVNGLEKMGVYDLRFSQSSRGDRKKKGRNLAEMVLEFDVPESMQQKRYGLGFDYDEELNVAVSASTDFGSKHKVGLWDCGSGTRIEQGALARRDFHEPVTCLQMIDLRSQGPSAKSILTKSGGIIEEWHV